MTDPIQQWRQMFADRDAGLYDLPADIVAAKAGVDRLDAELASHDARRPDAEAARRDVIAETVAASLAGRPVPDVAPIRKAATAGQDHEERRRIVSEARSQLASELVNAIADSADRIIADCLRPRHAAAVKQFADAAPVLPEHPTTDQLMKADDKTRKAWLGLADAAHAYSRVTHTAGLLNRVGRPLEHDLSGEFAWCKNQREIWPLYQVGRTPPWPTDDQRLSLLALVRLGADLWLPTNAEREAAWWAAHGEKVEAQRRNRHGAQALAQAVQQREPSGRTLGVKQGEPSERRLFPR